MRAKPIDLNSENETTIHHSMLRRPIKAERKPPPKGTRGSSNLPTLSFLFPTVQQANDIQQYVTALSITRHGKGLELRPASAVYGRTGPSFRSMGSEKMTV